jgi:ribonuclease BN (tRNA processing enzyme)
MTEWQMVGRVCATILAGWTIQLSALQPAVPAVTHTQVVTLGTGRPRPDPERSGPATAIVVGDTAYIVDVGPGVVRRAEAAYQKGIKGLAVAKLQTAFITHLHSDHTVGYPDLIFTTWVQGRKGPLRVFGPPGLEAMTQTSCSHGRPILTSAQVDWSSAADAG